MKPPLTDETESPENELCCPRESRMSDASFVPILTSPGRYGNIGTYLCQWPSVSALAEVRSGLRILQDQVHALIAVSTRWSGEAVALQCHPLGS